MRGVRPWLGIGSVIAAAVVPFALGGTGATAAASGSSSHLHIDCGNASAMCTEVVNSDEVFGHYVGHDEPSALFYSDTPGSGNRMRYDITLPKDPSASNPTQVGKSYQFELSGADWLGMAICDTQSFPEQVSTCPADSDRNILDPATSPKHVGEAYMEMQFYPPGWVPWPTWAVAVGASSCDPTKWCAALNIDSLSLNPVTGQLQNNSCASKVGIEYVNFAFITKDGKSTGPANPLDATISGTFTPNPSKDLFMNSGDNLQVAIHDTSNGVQVQINDLTTGESGSMTASKANGFAQVKFDPNGNSCTAIPYDFHPMYSTSSTRTRVTWAAGSYNVAFDSEIGHFQFCNGAPVPATEFGLNAKGQPVSCPKGNTEEQGRNKEHPDGDDIFCFPASEALRYKVQGCTYTNTGFDGVSYEPMWPNGNTILHPTPFRFSSPETGAGYDVQYAHVAFETDLPAVEGPCNNSTGAGCTLIPQDDDGQPAAFYPFYSSINTSDGCMWEFGSDIPHEISDYGQNAQYGTLLQQDYTKTGGGTVVAYEDFRNILSNNPCQQR